MEREGRGSLQNERLAESLITGPFSWRRLWRAAGANDKYKAAAKGKESQICPDFYPRFDRWMDSRVWVGGVETKGLLGVAVI